MIMLSQLKRAKGSYKKKKKVGRGTGSGHGKTACRGHKGQKSRSGGTKGLRFEGGQTPLYRRLPKMGTFKNYPFKRAYNIINVQDLNVFDAGEKVTVQMLKERFFSSSEKKILLQVKVLGKGEIKKAMTIEADKFSADAIAKIEKAGGKAIIPNAQ